MDFKKRYKMKKLKTIIFCFGIVLIAISSCETTKNEESSNTDIQQTNTQSESDYQTLGQQIALKAKSSLGEKLAQAIGEKGVPGAIEFCNLNAISITDSVSKSLNASIKRVSDKPRNKANQAREGELFYIDMCKKALAADKELKPFISQDDNKFMGYYPIVTNQICLSCHGDSKNIGTETLAKINSLYPDDKATGYKENEVRGLFVVELEKK